MNKLAIIRRLQGMSQVELAKLLGVPQCKISNFERKPIDLEFISKEHKKRLEQIFGRPVETLFERLVA